jgi:hypothetical protein
LPNQHGVHTATSRILVPRATGGIGRALATDIVVDGGLSEWKRPR